jgi:hypothetical protein
MFKAIGHLIQERIIEALDRLQAERRTLFQK